MVAALAVALAAAGAAGARSATAEFALRSRALDSPLHFVVYLPPGYVGSGLRYPVVYFLHGLPAAPGAFRTVFPEATLSQLRRQALVVAPQGTKRPDADDEYLDLGPGRDWETAISNELPEYVDSHFRTIANRRGRAIIGISAGGYGALAIGLHHLGTYSVIESWSGYGEPTNPAGTQVRDLGSAKANQRASVHAAASSLRRAFLAHPTFLGFFVGASDTRFRDENVRLDHELKAAGVPHAFEVYAGGHTQSLWSRHARQWLDLALDRLLPAAP